MSALWLVLAAYAHAASPSDFLADLELFRDRSVVLRTERQRFEADRSTALSRLLQATPAVSVAAGRSASRVKDEASNAIANSAASYWRVSADWNLFRGFGDYQAWSAAKEEEKAQGYQVRSQELQTELDGAKVIFRRLYLRDASLAQGELLQLKQETMRIGRDRYRQGKIPLQDVTKMELDLALQQNLVRQSEIDLAQNEAAYKAFFVDALRTSAWPFPESQDLALAEGEGSFLVKQLRSRAVSLEKSWLSARAAHFPSLDLSLGYKETPLQGPGARSLSGTLELSFPLWSRYETASASARSYSAFTAADGEAATAEREEGLRRDFLRKKIALSSANLKEARLNLEKSERLYRDMLRSFQLGRLSTNDLFQEQDRRIRALLSFSGSRLSFHESLMEACALWGLAARACLK